MCIYAYIYLYIYTYRHKHTHTHTHTHIHRYSAVRRLACTCIGVHVNTDAHARTASIQAHGCMRGFTPTHKSTHATHTCTHTAHVRKARTVALDKGVAVEDVDVLSNGNGGLEVVARDHHHAHTRSLRHQHGAFDTITLGVDGRAQAA